ncbi:hypothetical protein PILCRDRAFT_7827 [Piloderma croceum F 1598]|uniref:Homeobox domain-containing protein n=1 Tax=Piloderma croceum (strain F 1598) TaxID=765440 RepID=A0A0C3B7Z5_PILCF|nr:hypothetical protein PILCRDRAFT_7827 [Piloderma croceum F 1598]
MNFSAHFPVVPTSAPTMLLPSPNITTNTPMMPPSPTQDPVAASAEQVRAQMALLAAAASPPQRRRLPRLPEAATAILKDFFFTKTRYPTTTQKDDLVAQIRAQFEGFEWYDRETLSRWFSGQRGLHGNGKDAGEGKAKAKGRSHRKIKSDMILYPSLTKQSLSSLHVLLSETPDPAPAIIHIWADRLEATYKDVKCWIRLRKVQLGSESSAGDGGIKTKDEGDVEMTLGGGQAQGQGQGITILPLLPPFLLAALILH